MVSTWGAYLSMGSTVFFLVTTVIIMIFGRKSVANPWGAGATTLEWTVESPAPFHTFEEPPTFHDDQSKLQPAE